MKDMIWICKDGRRMRITEMETSHIRNAIAMIERSVKGWRRSYLERLRLELEIRNLT